METWRCRCHFVDSFVVLAVQLSIQAAPGWRAAWRDMAQSYFSMKWGCSRCSCVSGLGVWDVGATSKDFTN